MAMDKEKVLGVFQDIVCDLEIVGSNELDRELWHYYGNGLWNKLVSNKFLLVEFLESEFHSNHRLSPCVSLLRDCLWKVINALPFPWEVDNTEVYDAFTDLQDKCKEWLKWIDQYFPPEQPNQEQDYMEPAKQVNKPKRMTAAAKKLATPELQEVKLKLVDAGLIVNGQWVASVAEFECLVKELGKAEYDGGFGINTDKGNLARKECANFVGFTGDLESARSNTYHEQHSPNANLIKTICREIKTKYVK